MKKQNSVVVINDNLAESINLFNCKNFNPNNSQNFLDCSIAMPKIIVSNYNDVVNVVNGGEFLTPTFNNVLENEKTFNNTYIRRNRNPLEENRLVTEISNSHKFDLAKKIDTFIINSAEKILEIFESQYASLIYGETNLAEIDMLSQRYDVSPHQIKWLLKKVKDIRTDRIMFSIMDLDFEHNKATTHVTLKLSNPDTVKAFAIMHKLIQTDLFEVKKYYEYFNGIYDDLIAQFEALQETPMYTDELIKMFINYFKLLAMRTFECFDVFKNITLDTVSADKMCLLIASIEKQIVILESLL